MLCIGIIYNKIELKRKKTTQLQNTINHNSNYNNQKDMIQILKYPRTQHIEGSRKQDGDEDLDSASFSEIANCHIIIEEKMDGANSGISFSDDGKLLLQSRGHYLNGGPRERHFALFKTWANTFSSQLYEVLGNRYIMYGEWMYAKHTIFYTDLQHYFLEFDIFDKQKQVFLSTNERKKFWTALPFITPVKVLFEGKLQKLSQLTDFVSTSYFINNQQKEILRNQCEQQNLKTEQVFYETDLSQLMEGLYIKVETKGVVERRYKWVRHDFLQTALNSGSHWHDRPIIPNQLAIPLEQLFEM